MAVLFRDERFSTGGFHDNRDDPRFVQRCLIEDRLIICETITEASCSITAAVREISGPWDWWDHGKAVDFRVSPGYTDQLLLPVAWFITRVEMRQYDPIPWEAVEFPGLRGLRAPVLLSRHFRGTATVDIFEKPGSNAGVIIRGRFHGVESHVPATPVFVAAKMHLRAESGRLLWPFPRGTGFRGLLRRLEGERHPLASASAKAVQV